MRKTLLFAMLAAACASSPQRPAAIAKPEAFVEALGRPFFGDSGEAPLDLGVTITNRSSETLQVRSIRVASVGMAQYAIRSINQRFHDDIAPGETKQLVVPATAITSQARLLPSEPLTLRVDIAFETKSKKIFHELYSSHPIFF